MSELTEFLKENHSQKIIQLFFDIETFQYNEAAGRQRPTNYKNGVFSVCLSFYKDSENLGYAHFSNFYDMFEEIYHGLLKKNGTPYRRNPKIDLIAHNNNKYDNHFLLHELLYYYPEMIERNEYLKNALAENDLVAKVKELDHETKDRGVILEKRVKSKTNLELHFFIHEIEFQTVDNWVKTNLSIATLGKKLLAKGYIRNDDLKTDFDYLKYNLDQDLTEDQAHQYAKKIFKGLNADQLQYIKNDVLILAKSVKHYSDLFTGFDYSKITFTSNILEYYNTNELTDFQLLNQVKTGKDTMKINYTNFFFDGVNFYDYLKPFYRGGLNFYNQKYLGKIIYDPMFNIDLNSSYPYAMYHFDIPTELLEFVSFGKEQAIKITLDNHFYLYRISKNEFDRLLLNVNSRVLKQMLIKYYTTNEYVNINSNTLVLLSEVAHVEIKEMRVYSYLKYRCVPFGSKDHINDKYRVKMLGKSKKKLLYHDPFNIQPTDEQNDAQFNSEEVYNAKVLLNGLYGIPALRAYFNLFLQGEDEIESYPNGYQNSQRNIVFSIFITSIALLNLLRPLGALSAAEIDENFVYCDTDSLYLKKAVKYKIPTKIINQYALGSWKIEHDQIEKYYVLNHKKYAYQNAGKIEIRCGGVPLESFNTDMDFETFIKTQFSEGVEVKNNKGILNAQGTISIYPSITKLDRGFGYRMFANDPHADERKEKMFKEIRESEFDVSDVMYIESSFGTFSLADIYPHNEEIIGKDDLNYFKSLNNGLVKKLGV